MTNVGYKSALKGTKTQNV